MVVGLAAPVPCATELIIRFDYGWSVPWVRRIEGGLSADGRPDSVLIYTDVPLRSREHFTTQGNSRFAPGSACRWS